MLNVNSTNYFEIIIYLYTFFEYRILKFYIKCKRYHIRTPLALLLHSLNKILQSNLSLYLCKVHQ